MKSLKNVLSDIVYELNYFNDFKGFDVSEYKPGRNWLEEIKVRFDMLKPLWGLPKSFVRGATLGAIVGTLSEVVSGNNSLENIAGYSALGAMIDTNIYAFRGVLYSIGKINEIRNGK